MEKIFDNWTEAQQKIGLNKAITLRVSGKKVCLIRTNTQEIKAFEDACPHMRTPLSQGKITAQQEVVCPWHQYTFSLQTGEETQGRNISPLKFWEVISNSEGIFLQKPMQDQADEFSF